MQYCGIKVNSVTYFIIVMAIGLLVDFLMHILLRYYESKGKTRHAKVKETLETMGASILLGGFTTWLGVIPLAFSSTKIFNVSCVSYSSPLFWDEYTFKWADSLHFLSCRRCSSHFWPWWHWGVPWDLHCCRCCCHSWVLSLQYRATHPLHRNPEQNAMRMQWKCKCHTSSLWPLFYKTDLTPVVYCRMS